MTLYSHLAHHRAELAMMEATSSNIDEALGMYISRDARMPAAAYGRRHAGPRFSLLLATRFDGKHTRLFYEASPTRLGAAKRLFISLRPPRPHDGRGGCLMISMVATLAPAD